jgi:hypothetical protein
MTTGTQIIERAAKLNGVKQAGQSMTAEDVLAYLVGLNAMLIRWEADGLNMGFSAMSNAGSTIRIPVENEEAVTFNLAVVMAPEYPALPLSAYVVEKAREGLLALERDVIRPEPVCFDLPGSEAIGSYDINTD